MMKFVKFVLLACVLYVPLAYAGNGANITKPLVIFIAGGSGSGKTTFANKIAKLLSNKVVVLRQDSYYIDFSNLPIKERSNLNFDHPVSIDFDLLRSHLKMLIEGKIIQAPKYNFSTYSRESATEKILPGEVIVVEGILVLAVPKIADLCDMKLFIDTDDDVRLLRRIYRDVNERHRTIENIKCQYFATVRPMHKKFVEPSKSKADLVISGEGDNKVALDIIVSKIKQHIENNKIVD